VLAFALPAHEGSAGSLEQEAEHEQTVKIGVTSCGVERWSIKTGTDKGAAAVNQKAIVPHRLLNPSWRTCAGIAVRDTAAIGA
jgi:hypothetical protein